ncbi:MAG TPA: SgcJ/EcaC family oxidoreductase [Planctomycetaceae bacterium]|jgi:uncharacterized protein (TIGR02246 family)|nr:SgcJ/EcaC family oxidoreductase [Planctomycetaceae bacterium]
MCTLEMPPRRLRARDGLLWLAPALLILAAGAVAADKATENESAEAAIRANVNAFVKAYNSRDADAIAHLFVTDAQLIDENEHTTLGREAIERVFASIFAASPQGRIEVDVDSIRLIGSALAIETGSTKVVSKPGEVADVSHYTVVHTKSRSGNWLMAFARDTPTDGTATLPRPADSTRGNADAQLSNYERLKPLDWMIGDWIDEGDDSIVLSSCKWNASKSFILQKIEVRRQGSDALDLSQRIGWDPLTRQIKSWVFDSEGGYGESLWTQEGNHWRAKATGVRPDGTTSSATNILTPTGKDSYIWRSTDRIVGGEKMPPIEVKVVRKPPEPAK